MDKVLEHNLLLPSWQLTYPLPAGTFEDDASYLDPKKMYLWIKFPGGFLDLGFSDPHHLAVQHVVLEICII